jgi:hypothetical protein
MQLDGVPLYMWDDEGFQPLKACREARDRGSPGGLGGVSAAVLGEQVGCSRPVI